MECCTSRQEGWAFAHSEEMDKIENHVRKRCAERLDLAAHRRRSERGVRHLERHHRDLDARVKDNLHQRSKCVGRRSARTAGSAQRALVSLTLASRASISV